MNLDRDSPNLARLTEAAKKLEPLLDQIVFVGGCITELFITDPAAPPVRPTLDVDAIVEIGSYAELWVLQGQLGDLGFREPQDVICRWLNEGLIPDLMPTDPSILGFSNRWYSPAIKDPKRIRLEAHEVQLISAPFFLATKLEAFHGRGKNDFRMSHDLEDIVTVIDGRTEIVDELRFVQPELQNYLSEEFGVLLSNRDFLEALPGHLLPDVASQQRASLVLERIRRLTLKR